MLRNICNHLYSVEFVANFLCCGWHFVSASALNQALCFLPCLCDLCEFLQGYMELWNQRPNTLWFFWHLFLMKCKADFVVIHCFHFFWLLILTEMCQRQRVLSVHLTCVQITFLPPTICKVDKNQHTEFCHEGTKKERCRCFEPVVI